MVYKKEADMEEKLKEKMEEMKAEHKERTEKAKETFKCLIENQKSQAEIIWRHFLQAQKELLEFQLGLVEDSLRIMSEKAAKKRAVPKE
jgi:hypothetical protein